MLRLLAFAALNMAAIAAVASAAGLRINTTASQPVGFYRASEAPWARGDLVEVCLAPEAARLATERGYLATSGACGTHPPLLKRVLALGGDVVTVDRHVALNGRRLSSAPVLAHDTAGRSLEPAAGGRLADDEIWLLSDHVPNSYDSRYFGAVRVTAVRTRLEALWTF